MVGHPRDRIRRVASILETLRKVRPSVVMVRRQEGEPIKLALRKGRARWESAAATVESMVGVEEVELRDLSGGVVGVWSPDLDPSIVPMDAPEPAVGSAGDTARMLELMLRAQQAALQAQAEMLRPMVDGYRTLLTTVTDRLTAMERNYSGVLRAQFEAVTATAQAQVQASVDGDGGMKSDALMAQVIPIALQKLAESKAGAL